MQTAKSRIPRWALTLSAFLSLCCGFCCPWTTFLGNYPGFRIVSLQLNRPAPTLLKKTGLELPEVAEIRRFSYGNDLCGEYLTLVFDVPKEDALEFIAQEPLAKAEWERHENPIENELRIPDFPKTPYRHTTLASAEREFLQVDVEERVGKDWTVWVRWSTDV